jgi:3-methyladenine DNA glycosylase AlkD
MNQYTEEIINGYKEFANPEIATPMKKYLKDKFEMYGIKTPLRRQILKDIYKQMGWPKNEDSEEIIRELFEKPERECHYAALDLAAKYGKKAPRERIELYEYLITTHSWWDTVDITATKCVGEYFKLYPDAIEEYTEKWMNSGNMWLQRTCILFQLKYKKDTDLNLLFSFIERLTGSKEFFINKAIGWVLREYAKTDPMTVIEYVEAHPELANLSKREALKILNK